MSIFLLFFLAGFASGVVFGCTFGADYRDYAGILSEYYMSRYSYMEPDRKGLFLHLMKERMLPEMLLLFFVGSVPGRFMLVGYLSWVGFSLGTTLTLSIIRFGGAGILLCVAAMFPQYFLYVSVWYLLIRKGYKETGSRGGRYYMSKAGRVGDIIYCLGIFMLQVAGILAETFINPVIVNGILKIL